MELASKSARKRRSPFDGEKSEDLLQDLVATVGTHTKEKDCLRISKLIGCCVTTVKNFHAQYLSEQFKFSSASSVPGAAAALIPASSCINCISGSGLSGGDSWSRPSPALSPVRAPRPCPSVLARPRSNVLSIPADGLLTSSLPTSRQASLAATLQAAEPAR